MLWQRVVVSIAGIPLLLYSFYRGETLLLVLITALIMLSLGEYNKLVKKSGRTILILPLLLSGLILPLLVLIESPVTARMTLFVLVLFIFLIFVLRFPRYGMEDLGLTLLGIVYIVGGYTHILLVRTLDNGFWLITFAFLIIWSTDTGAYFSGLLLGRHKLAPQLSPNKTWEGFSGGLIFSLLIVYIYLRFINIPNEKTLLCITPLVSLTAQLGDLFESALKRFAAVKDSGTLIPGHGGFLDRFDSALWAVPSAYYLISLAERVI